MTAAAPGVVPAAGPPAGHVAAVVSAAPPPTPELAAQLRSLLPAPAGDGDES